MQTRSSRSLPGTAHGPTPPTSDISKVQVPGIARFEVSFTRFSTLLGPGLIPPSTGSSGLSRPPAPTRYDTFVLACQGKNFFFPEWSHWICRKNLHPACGFYDNDCVIIRTNQHKHCLHSTLVPATRTVFSNRMRRIDVTIRWISTGSETNVSVEQEGRLYGDTRTILIVRDVRRRCEGLQNINESVLERIDDDEGTLRGDVDKVLLDPVPLRC